MKSVRIKDDDLFSFFIMIQKNILFYLTRLAKKLYQYLTGVTGITLSTGVAY